MIVITNKQTGKKEKISYEDFRKNFQKERDEQIKKDILKALQKNYKKLSDNGHEIIAPSFFIDKIELPDEYVFQFTRKHYSKYGDYKKTMFDQNDNVLDYVFGVYNLEILKSLCEIVGWKEDKHELFFSLWGRGSQAEVCIENINKHFSKNNKQ